MMKNTIQLALLICFTAIISLTNTAHAEIIDPKADDYQVTTEMLAHDDGSAEQGATDLIGKSIYKYMQLGGCLLYTSPSPRDKRQSRMPSSA